MKNRLLRTLTLSMVFCAWMPGAQAGENSPAQFRVLKAGDQESFEDALIQQAQGLALTPDSNSGRTQAGQQSTPPEDLRERLARVGQDLKSGATAAGRSKTNAARARSVAPPGSNPDTWSPSAIGGAAGSQTGGAPFQARPVHRSGQ